MLRSLEPGIAGVGLIPTQEPTANHTLSFSKGKMVGVPELIDCNPSASAQLASSRLFLAGGMLRGASSAEELSLHHLKDLAREALDDVVLVLRLKRLLKLHFKS